MSDNLTPAARGEPPEGQLLIYRDGALDIQVRLDGQTVWLTQAGMAELFQTTPQNITMHVGAIYEESELAEEATCKEFLQVRTEGGRQVQRSLRHYNLEMILAVGYRVRSHVGTRFRQWATAQLRDLLTKGFVLDDERIKAGRTIGQDYFDELLARIRDIRASERLFYQKITDIYATSIDYDANAEVSRQFFATVQNKLHWAVHGRTAAEVIRERADAAKPNMGLTTWKNAPRGPVRKTDVEVAKNYLTEAEITELNRVVSMYLDYAEDQARKKKPMHMCEWAQKLDTFLQFNEREVLTHKGTISHDSAMEHASLEFDKYEQQRLGSASGVPMSDFDQLVDESRRLVGEMPTALPPSDSEPKTKGRRRQRRKNNE
jgi:hypothetical protein